MTEAQENDLAMVHVKHRKIVLTEDALRELLEQLQRDELLPTFVALRLDVKPYIGGSRPQGALTLATLADLRAWHAALRSSRGDASHGAPRRDRSGAPVTSRWAYARVGGWRLRLSASEPAPEDGTPIPPDGNGAA